MKVKKAHFVKSAVDLKGCPNDGLSEVAFAGRSNVGKSSLINSLLGRKLAVTSKSPGRTRTINFFMINDSFYFVDLPGYGYAKAARKVVSSWGPMIEAYIEGRTNLSAMVHIVDARHQPSEGDRIMQDYLDRLKVPRIVVATKIDKLSRGTRKENLKKIAGTLGLPQSVGVIPFSASAGDGRKDLWNVIGQHISQSGSQSRLNYVLSSSSPS